MHAKKINIKNSVYSYSCQTYGLANKLKSCKTLKKDISKELLPVAWHRTGCWNCCMSENEKRVIGSIFTDKVGKW